MKKTHKKQEIEKQIGESLEDFLRRGYLEEHKTANRIGGELGVSGELR